MNELLDLLTHGWRIDRMRLWDDGVVEVKLQHRVRYSEWHEVRHVA